jgi:integrase
MINTEGLSTYDYCHKRLFLNCRMKGYSMENTYKVYKAILNQILERFPEPENIGLIDIQEFASSFTNNNTRKNICIILRWLFGTVYSRPLDWRELPYPKRTKKVQPIYNRGDILKVLHSIKNAKQKAILALIIDQGLRVSEPCGILVKDCNSKERSIILRSAKGDHDRVIYPSQFVWHLIKIYWNQWKKEVTDKYLFEGQVKGNPYTTHSIQAFLERKCKLAGIEYLGTHAIRRFTGTWWIENNVPLNVAAEKMGHSSSRTLEKHYLIHSPTYLKSVASPLS